MVSLGCLLPRHSWHNMAAVSESYYSHPSLSATMSEMCVSALFHHRVDLVSFRLALYHPIIKTPAMKVTMLNLRPDSHLMVCASILNTD